MFLYLTMSAVLVYIVVKYGIMGDDVPVKTVPTPILADMTIQDRDLRASIRYAQQFLQRHDPMLPMPKTTNTLSDAILSVLDVRTDINTLDIVAVRHAMVTMNVRR